jgi:single-strand DNA-binding protein
MGATVNRWELIGRIGRSGVEVRETASGHLATFSLATDHFARRADGTFEERTDWHRAFAFGPKADQLAEALRTGDLVRLEGPLIYDTFEREGVSVTSTRIRVDRFDRLARPVRAKAPSSEEEAASTADPAEPSQEELAAALADEPMAEGDPLEARARASSRPRVTQKHDGTLRLRVDSLLERPNPRCLA